MDQFQPNQLFTFGFPIIRKSQGRIFEFEIESIRGKPGNAIGLSPVEPIFVARYSFPKKELLANKKELLLVLSKRSIEEFTNPSFIVTFIIYLLPLLIYALWFLFFYPQIKKRYYLALLPVLFVLLDIIFIPAISQIIVALVSILWVVMILIYRIDSRLSYLLALIFLLSCPFLVVFHLEQFAVKVSVWVYMFLLIGTAEQIWLMRSMKSNYMAYDKFLKKAWFQLKQLR